MYYRRRGGELKGSQQRRQEMRIEFNRTGAERKELVKAIEKITEEKSKYLGAPSMAYQIGVFTVTRDGAIESDDTEGLENLTESLAFEGILSEHKADAGQPAETAQAETDGTALSIEMPRGFFSDEALENLRKIVDSKASLIKKAVGTDELPITVTDDKVTFAWFTAEGADEAKAYGDFISKLCLMAKEAKRVVAKDKEVESEKFAFRCFLLRLGFIGAEFKTERKILLKNLDGSAAFPTKEAARKFEEKRKAEKEAAS